MESLARKAAIAFFVALFLAVGLAVFALKTVQGERRARAELRQAQKESATLKASNLLLEETLRAVVGKMNSLDDSWRKAGESVIYAGQYREVTPENLTRFLRPCESKPRTVGCSRYKKGEKVPIYVGVLDLKPKD